MPHGDHIIVLPGGGYERHADHEGEPVAQWLRDLGLTASVFAYPVRTRHPEPLRAIRGAITAARSQGATRVGLLGFSAGGHAAAFAAVAPGATPDERVDLAITAYPVVSMELDSHRGSRVQLLGDDAAPILRTQTSADRLVTADTPPFFIWHTADDEAVPVAHSLLLASALSAQSVPYELHVYESGVHGLGLAPDAGTAEGWTTACEQWLRARGWID
ncbi:acetyl esterase/lipase [Microbacterium marinum]|uniref:Acetyl esterase/lipase n=1 Tax=Microbacterium marinum TaxID=421115 RepID=A0A7W7BSX3_9MICO|nr:prolyl oligopeptidase family serine peptidase [Microbacterium marinum]MBB4668234.1 acetyl esterase/lipase [Microbacterium marinum]